MAVPISDEVLSIARTLSTKAIARQLAVSTSTYKRAKSTSAKANVPKAKIASMVISHTISVEPNLLPPKDFQLKMLLKNPLWLLLITLWLVWIQISVIWLKMF